MTSGRRRALAALALCLGAAAATFLLAGVHHHREAVRRLDAAHAAFVAQQWRSAADDAHAAALRAWPGSAVQRDAFVILEQTARSAGASGDAASAVIAWTEMRQAAIAERSALYDTDGWRREAEEGVRASSDATLAPAAAGAPSDGARLVLAAAALLVALALGALTRGRGPRPPAAAPRPGAP